MFERYTEKARRVIFFARYEASQFGSPYIETEHLLLGLLREDRAVVKGVPDKVNAEEEIRAGSDLWHATGARLYDPFLLGQHAEVLTLAGRTEDASAKLAEACRHHHRPGPPLPRARVYPARAAKVRSAASMSMTARPIS